ncbi:MAG: ankyrin repeat domain-containing protein, partial [Gammaproteobacteria bacterium]
IITLGEVTCAQHPPRAEDFVSVTLLSNLGQAKLRPYAERICDLLCNYWQARQEKILGSGNYGDPHSLFLHEFNHWAQEVLSRAEPTADFEGQLQARIKYVQYLERSPLFQASSLSTMTFRYSLLKLRQILQEAREYVECKQLNASAQEDLEKLQANIRDLLTRGLQISFILFKESPIGQDYSLENLIKPSSHCRSIQNYYQTTQYGQLLQTLVARPALMALIGTEQSQTIPTIEFTKNNFIQYQENAISPHLHLVTNEERQTRGVIAYLEQQADGQSQFIQLHGLLESIGQFYQMMRMLINLARFGGDFMVYGVMNEPLRRGCVDFLKVVDYMQMTIKQLFAIATQYYDKLLSENKRSDWLTNYNTAETLYSELDTSLRTCRETITRVMSRASQGISMQQIQEARNNMQIFTGYVSAYGCQLGGYNLPVLSTADQIPIEQIHGAPSENVSPPRLMLTQSVSSQEIGDLRIRQLNQIFAEASSVEILRAWCLRPGNQQFPTTELEQQWMREWYKETQQLMWSPLRQQMIDKFCDDEIKQAYHCQWLACLFANSDYGFCDHNSHDCDRASLEAFFGDRLVLIDMLERYCLSFLDGRSQYNKTAMTLINTYLSSPVGNNLFDDCSAQKNIIEQTLQYAREISHTHDVQLRQALFSINTGHLDEAKTKLNQLFSFASQSNDTPDMQQKHWQSLINCLLNIARQDYEYENFNLVARLIWDLNKPIVPQPIQAILQNALTEVQFNNRLITLLLIQLGADPVCQLHEQNGYSFMHRLASEGQLDILRCLFDDCKIPIDKPMSHDNSTLLHSAAVGGQQAICEYLLSRPEADANAVNSKEFTPLHTACMKGSESIVQLLLKQKASTGVVDKEGQTPLHIAVRKRHGVVVERLLQAGADPDAGSAQSPPVVVPEPLKPQISKKSSSSLFGIFRSKSVDKATPVMQPKQQKQEHIETPREIAQRTPALQEIFTKYPVR